MRVILTLLVLIIIASELATLSGCANIIPPGGGPRDSLPPVLRTVTPPDSSRNFAAKKITFTFDEFVEIDNPRQNLLVSPVPKIDPVVESKLRTVTVTIKDTLEPNTTYSIDFGNAIKDINEGNVLKNFRYLFTTGTYFDSLQLTGNVVVAETGKPDSTLIVMLHTILDDSAVIKERPRYVARLDSSGRFRFRNLPPGTFAIYALKDEGGQRRYLSKQQLFAFADSAVVTQDAPGPITLYAYAEKEETEETETPSLQRPAARGRRAAAAPDNLQVSLNTPGGQLDLLSQLEIGFSTPLREFDSTKVQLTTDSFDILTGYHFLRDTSNQKVTLVYKWTENTGYNLILDSTVATDTLGRRIPRTDTIAFRTRQAKEYGEVRLRLLNLDLSLNPVLQFVQGDQVKFAYPMTSRNFNATLFPPGEYDLRILYDENKNGIWDTGSFFENRKQPEKVQPIPRRLNIKANWLNEIDITL